MSLVWVAPLGLLVGVVLGALGAGGGVLTVPILVYAFGQPGAQATTGSLVVAGLGSLAGLVPHARQGDVRVREGLTLGVLGALGAVAGSRVAVLLPEPVLLTAFAALLLVVAVLLLRKARASSPGEPGRPPRPNPFVLVAAAAGVGLLTGIFGVGGGFAVVPLLVLAFGFPMATAVGTSLLVVALNSASALAARVGTGLDLDWPLVLTFSVVVALGTFAGGRVARRLDSATLTRVLAALLVLVAAYVAIENVPRLLG